MRRKVRIEVDIEALQKLIEEGFGVTAAELATHFSCAPNKLTPYLTELERQGQLIGFSGVWFTVESLTKAKEKFETTLKEMHSQKPERTTFEVERVLKRAGFSWGKYPSELILKHFEEGSFFKLENEKIRLTGASNGLTAKQEALLQRVAEALDSHGINVPESKTLAQELGMPIQALEAALDLGLQEGKFVQVAAQIVYTQQAIEKFKQEIKKLDSGEGLEIGFIRDSLGTSRKYIIPLLEYFDEVGFTERDEDGLRRTR